MQGLPSHVPHERRLNWGLQSTGAGFPIYPVPKESIFHRSINQSDEFGLWVDFGRWRPSDPIKQQAYLSTLEHTKPRRRRFFGESASASGTQQSSKSLEEEQLTAAHRPAPLVHFVGYVKWHMDGRNLTGGEMDRLMHQHAQSKYPCARPATFEEYTTGRIAGLPARNLSGFDVTFVGPQSCSEAANNSGACHDTLGYRKKVVLTGDDFDGRTTNTGAMWGEKAVLAVVPVARYLKQPSLTTHGQLRGLLDQDGRIRNLRRSRSLAGLGRGAGAIAVKQLFAGGKSNSGGDAAFAKTVSSDGFHVVDESGRPKLWKSWPDSANASATKETLNDGRQPGSLPSHGKHEPSDQHYPLKRSIFG